MRPVPTALASIVAALLLAGGGPVSAGSDHHHHHANMTAAEPSGDSVYAVTAALRDQLGQPVGLDVFRGHPVLVGMFYGTCKDACPLLIADLHRIEQEIPPPARADVRVLLVSFDPERDTPAALLALARAHHADPARWRFVTARDDDTVRLIAAVLGIKYRRLPDGHFNHSSVITLLDPEGAIAARLEGIGQPSDKILAHLPAR
jgi:protein SCO1/2